MQNHLHHTNLGIAVDNGRLSHDNGIDDDDDIHDDNDNDDNSDEGVDDDDDDDDDDGNDLGLEWIL